MVRRSGPRSLAGSFPSEFDDGKVVADRGMPGWRKASPARSLACDPSREILGGTVDMALGLYFTPSTFTPARYDDTIKRLEEAGAGAPPGRLYHVALESGGLIQVFDVWDSEESFQAFGATLLPIMADLGVDPGQPQVSPVRNLIRG